MSRRKRANTAAYELRDGEIVGTDGSLATEVESLRTLIHDLRNPVGSVSMAVEMLVGPLADALTAMEPVTRTRVEGVLVALSESTRQLRHLVSDLGIAAGQGSATAGAAAGPTLAAVTEEPAPVHSPTPTVVQVEDLLQRLEILTVTRSALPALLAVDAEPGLEVHAHGAELLRALSNLVENAIEASAAEVPGPGPWTVELKARGSGDEVKIEIRNRGAALPEQMFAWLASPAESEGPESSKSDGGLHGLGLKSARRVVERYGGRLEAESKHGISTLRICLPQHGAEAAI